jgi:diguanylate cyclase (GGDEF)-like protein/PAS domain S-box-containing protein
MFDAPSSLEWFPPSRWKWGHAAHAVLLPLVALALHLRLAPYLHQFPVVLFLPAVFISGWLGGRRWAMVATGVSIALAGYFLVPSEVAVALEDPGNLLAKAVVVGMGLMLMIIYGRLRAATERANEVHHELQQRSEVRFRALMEHSTDGIVLLDDQQTIRRVSPAVTLVEGHARQDLLGHSCFEHTHPDDVARLQELFAQLLAEPERSAPLLWRRRRADGRWLWLEGFAINLLHEPAVHAIVINYRDITARREGELVAARLAAIVTSSDDAIFSLDLQGMVTSWNRAAERLSGFSEAEMVGQPVVNLIPDESRSDEAAVLARICDGEHVATYETVRLQKSGARIPVSIAISPIQNLDGTVIGASAIVRDISVSRQAEEARRQAEYQLRDQQFYTRSLIEANIDALMATDPQGIITDVNWQAETLTGCSRNELIGRPFRDCFTDVERAEATIRRVLSEGRVTNDELTVRARHGERTVVSYNATTFYDRHGALQGVFAAARDMTELKRVEDALFTEKERAQVTLHSIADGVISTNAQGEVTFVNAAAAKLTGWTASMAIGLPLVQVFHVVEAAHSGAGRSMAKRDRSLVRRDGSTLPIEDSIAPIHQQDGQTTGAVIVFRDVTASRAMTLKMAHSAHHDGLTDLPNRTLFDDRLRQAVVLARREQTRVAVLFVDLDRFKYINDSLGHATGDALLQSVAGRLRRSVRASDTVSRHGGDEFVVLLAPVQRAEQAGVITEKIITALAAPHDLSGQLVSVTASVGISVHPDDGEEPEALIRAADMAMYHAKERGRGNGQFFTADMNEKQVARQSLEASLRLALQHQELALHYQPKVDLATSRMTGVEALIRWRHPTRGLVSPSEFIPAAEECGLIQPLGQWALREACSQARAWHDAGLRSMPMAVNVSMIEFGARGFLDHVTRVLEETGLDPDCLELEVTESVLMADTKSTTTALYALKDLGIRLAIDDFGTGYSSLSYLSRFPIASLKIDQSFLRGMAPGGQDASIVHAVIGMGSALKLRVIAEGVENQEQLAWLRCTSCDEGQGYYFSRPVAAEAFADLLRHDGPLAVC